MKLCFVFLIILGFLPTYAGFKSRRNCLLAEYHRFAGDYLPGEIHASASNWQRDWDGAWRRSIAGKVVLKVSKKNDLRKMARLLSQGKYDPEIYKKLKAAAATTGEIDLKEVAPQIVKRMTNKTNDLCNDANCFNAVLLWHKLVDKIDHTAPHILENYLKNHFKQLKKGSQFKFGDVILFKEAKDPDRIVIFPSESRYFEHAAIYIDDGLIWHKPGADADAPYIFEMVEGAIEDFHDAKNGSRIEFYRRK